MKPIHAAFLCLIALLVLTTVPTGAPFHQTQGTIVPAVDPALRW
ncbi:hypothetical protein LARV_03712 [Longilinea arvoryzae]|uniref:Uncharacterized protein n=1 Tax=Longilinea arvoryzae TaxID=360412 RepID=A0A0K8MZ63_9CHLR|nr:hypothetical protein [Longilinea arvoryzae]GAP15917.1 hypothetical protein LARV_03712 [Longilinea arvoryzae]